MTIVADYSVGVHLLSISKLLTTSLNNCDYFSTAVMQAFQMHMTTETAAKALRAYSISTGKAFPWYIRALAIAALPCSVCFEINRWSPDYQPAFWKKRAIHWICDHIDTCTYAIFIVSSIALTIVGQPGILLGTITTFSIQQIHNHGILPSYYCHVLKATNMLAGTYFSRGISSCLVSVAFLIAELIGNTYFLAQPVRQILPTNNAFTTGKTVDDVKINPIHIHYTIELDGDVKDVLTIFDETKWELTQCKELLLGDPFWIKRADIRNTDPFLYILNFRSIIKQFIDKLAVCPEGNKKKSTELYLKVFIQYLKDLLESPLQSQKLLLEFAIQLKASQQKGIDYLEKNAGEHYEKIKSLPLEQKVLQLFYKKRKEIFTKLVDNFFAEDQDFYAVANPNFIDFFRPYIQDAFDSHMGINLFPKDERSALLEACIQAACANIPAERYFCDQESSEFYTPQVIIDVLIDALEIDVNDGKVLCDDMAQWFQKQGITVNLVSEIIHIQKAKQRLRQLAQISDEYYYQFNHLRHLNALQLDCCYRSIREDCRAHFQVVKEKMKVEGDSEELSSAVLSDVRRALFAYLELEKHLNSLLLKMGIFQVNCPSLK